MNSQEKKQQRAVLFAGLLGPLAVIIVGPILLNALKWARRKTFIWLFPLLIVFAYTANLLILILPLLLLFIWYVVLESYFIKNQIFRPELTSLSSIILSGLIFALITSILLWNDFTEPLLWAGVLVVIAGPLGHWLSFYATNLAKHLSFSQRRTVLVLVWLILITIAYYLIFHVN